VADEPRAAESSSRIALGILVVALILGAGLRCYRLGGDELNRGEAAAWAAASAPTIRDVIASGRRIDPGKLGLYDVALHGWIAMFGDGVGAMRAPSAILGSLSILLIFLAVREILRWFDSASDRSVAEFAVTEFAVAELAGAFAALLLACNLQMITWDRTARMYSPMLAAMLAQLFFFVRAHRQAGLLNTAAAAIFTMIAVAFNYTALFFFAAEGLWLAYVFIARNARDAVPKLSFVRPALALIAAAALVVPLAAMSSGIEVHALHAGALKSIERQSPWWPFRAMQVLAGNAAFWPLLALSIFGVWYQRTRAPRAIGFIACWMVVPFAIDMIVSYAITPFMLERYVLASLVAFLVLAAIGLASIQSGVARYAIAVIVVAQSLAHIHHHWRSPEDIQWREAAQFAAAVVPNGKKVALMPPGEPQYVVHYYLTPHQRDVVVNSDASFDGTTRTWAFRCGREPIAIVQLELPREFLNRIEQCYPRTLRKFRHLEVLAR
jgi:mannosyltransferase